MACPAGVDQQTWAALLRWSMKATAEHGGTGDGTKPTEFKQMSKENQAWLTAVMKEGVVDLVKKAGEILDVIRRDALAPARRGEAAAMFSRDGDGGGAEEKLEALLGQVDELQDICEQIDFAQSLVQIGGLPVLLEAAHPARGLPEPLRAAVLGTVATVAQNNPFAQNALFNLHALPLLVAIAARADSGGGGAPGAALRVKALHCLSCLVRGYGPAEAAFLAGQDPGESASADFYAQMDSSEAAKAGGGSMPPSGQAPPPAAEAAEAASSSAPPPPPQQHSGLPLPAIPGPAVLAVCLSPSSSSSSSSSSGGDLRLVRKAAFLLHALCGPDEVPPSTAQAYFDATHALLLPLVAPPADQGTCPTGQAVDTREAAIRALATFAKKGLGPALTELHGPALAEARAYAEARAGDPRDEDRENAQAEAALWTTFFEAAVASP